MDSGLLTIVKGTTGPFGVRRQPDPGSDRNPGCLTCPPSWPGATCPPPLWIGPRIRL